MTFIGQDINSVKNYLVLFVLLLCLSSVSCGYTTSGSTLASHLKTIHVEPFKNSIDYGTERKRNLYIPLLEVDVRNAVIDRFAFDGNLKIAEDDSADLILRGTLENYERGALRHDDDDNVQEYRITVTVSLEMWDTKEKKILWREPSFSGDADYFVSGANAKSEESAIDDALSDLARRIVERMIEDW